MTSHSLQKNERNIQFDLLRILFAILVLLSHAFEITDGNSARELFARFSRSAVTFGTLAVDGFFLLSGYLIVQSWDRRPILGAFIRKRVLRIVPGYTVAALLSTLVIGILAPAEPHFFQGLRGHYLESVLLLSSPLTPPVLPGNNYPLVNGSLWTISYEFRCYLLVAVLGSIGLLRRPWLWLVGTVVSFTLWLSPFAHEHLYWQTHFVLKGDPHEVFRMLGAFLVGGSFYLLRKTVRFSRPLAFGSVIAVVAAFWWSTVPELTLIVCGGYLMFYFGRMRISVPKWVHQIPDISYGVYLYGWPVQALWIWYFRGSPWITFVVSVFVCCGLGLASWTFVEEPMLKRKVSRGTSEHSVRMATNLKA